MYENICNKENNTNQKYKKIKGYKKILIENIKKKIIKYYLNEFFQDLELYLNTDKNG